jgi:hypothetical protein
MKLPALILMACCIGCVLVGGCTDTTSQPPPVTTTMEQTATPTVRVTAPVVPSTIPAEDTGTDTLCGEVVYCGLAPSGIATPPIKSSRCNQLYTLYLNNDQRVMECLENPGEAEGTDTDEKLYEIALNWDKGLAGSGNALSGRDGSIQQTNDGGYIVIGSINGEVSPGHGSEDMWVAKLNPIGDIQWVNILGGDGLESGRSIQATTDGGYIAVGYTTSSNSGDVGLNHGGFDVWVVKLNSAGTIQWQTVLGGSGDDSGFSIQQATDGGYILTGITDSDNTGNVGLKHGGYDVWVVKLLTNGNIQWQRVLGGNGNDGGFDIQATPDGEYILTGITDSDNNGDVGINHGGYDVWAVRLNPIGNILWQKVLGGEGDDSGFSIHLASDGGYILTGITDSDNTGDVGLNHGGFDVWAVKLNPAGGIQWQKVLGGSGDDSGFSIWQADDGGYILTGATDSDNTGDVGLNHGGFDVWVVKLLTNGNIQWQRTLGGNDFESGRSIQQTPNGEYIFAGITGSDETGDVGLNQRGLGIWVVRLNPIGDILWQRVLGEVA